MLSVDPASNARTPKHFEIIMVSRQDFQSTSQLLQFVTQFSISFILAVISLFNGFFWWNSQAFGSEHFILNSVYMIVGITDCGNFLAAIRQKLRSIVVSQKHLQAFD